MIRHLSQTKAVNDMGSSLLSQVFAVRMIANASKFRQIRTAEITACLDHIEGALTEHLPEWT